MTIMKTLGERARARRRELHLTLEDVGDLLGLSKAQVSRIETGKSRVTVDVVERLAVILKTDVESLVFLVADDETAPRPGELQRLAAEVERSKPEKVGMVEGFLRAVLMLSTFTVIAGGLAAGSSEGRNLESGRHNAYHRGAVRRKRKSTTALDRAA